MVFSIKQAELDDLDQVAAILLEAAEYLMSIGQPLWEYKDIASSRIKDDIAEGLFFIAYLDGEAAGTMKYQLEDEIFWRDIPKGTSGFVHKLCLKRDAASTGLSAQMLQWAKDHTRELGRDYLRLDCDIRPKLCNFYECNGFKKHSERQIGAHRVARYEFDVRSPEKKL